MVRYQIAQFLLAYFLINEFKSKYEQRGKYYVTNQRKPKSEKHKTTTT